MRRAFADTGYWIALLNPRDRLHEIARRRSLELDGARIYTSGLVLIEVLNDFGARGEELRRRAATLVLGLRQDHDVVIVDHDASHEGRVLELYMARHDKEWSYTDCFSFLTMQDLGLTEALAHDQHFVQAGFHALLREA